MKNDVKQYAVSMQYLRLETDCERSKACLVVVSKSLAFWKNGVMLTL